MTPLENPGDISDKPRLTTQKLSLGYGQQLIINKLSLSLKTARSASLSAQTVVVNRRCCERSAVACYHKMAVSG